MLTQTPDYIISDCGCPQWNSNALTTIGDLYIGRKSLLIKEQRGEKLLPLRETLSEYYSRLLSQTSRDNKYDAAYVKQQKNQRNEYIKQRPSR